MKVFTTTPAEFVKGTSAVRAVDLFKGRAPRKSKLKQPPLERQPLKVGTITPEQFGTGEAYYGCKNRRSRHPHLAKIMKPLAETVVANLLEEENGNRDRTCTG